LCGLLIYCDEYVNILQCYDYFDYVYFFRTFDFSKKDSGTFKVSEKKEILAEP